MTLTVNGKAQDSEAATLGALVQALGLGDATVATALNGAFVPAAARERIDLADGDRIEILAPMQGG